MEMVEVAASSRPEWDVGGRWAMPGAMGDVVVTSAKEQLRVV